MTDGDLETTEATKVVTEGFENIQNPAHRETAEDLSEYLRRPNALIRLIKRFLRCVDPRDRASMSDVKEGQYEEGNIARPGADFGYIMVLLAANEYLIQQEAGTHGRTTYEHLTPEQIVGIAMDWKRSLRQQFVIHGDDHARGPKTGCGHIDNATSGQHAEAYGISAQSLSRALDYTLSAVPDMPDMTILTGKHVEEGVLVVDSENTTIPSTITNKGGKERRFFRYDRAVDRKNLASLLGFLRDTGHSIGHVIDLDTFIQMSDKQLGATLGILASGLPIFEATLAPRQPKKLAYKGTV